MDGLSGLKDAPRLQAQSGEFAVASRLKAGAGVDANFVRFPQHLAKRGVPKDDAFVQTVWGEQKRPANAQQVIVVLTL